MDLPKLSNADAKNKRLANKQPTNKRAKEKIRHGKFPSRTFSVGSNCGAAYLVTSSSS